MDILIQVFKDNEVLLKAMRAVMLNLLPTSEEKELVRSTFNNEALYNAVSQKFIPTISKDSPIGQVADVWLGVEQMVYGHPRDTIEQAMRYKDASIKMTKQALKLLKNPDETPVEIKVEVSDFNLKNDPLAIFILARNQFLRHIENQLLFLFITANQDKKEDIQKRLKQNSAQ